MRIGDRGVGIPSILDLRSSILPLPMRFPVALAAVLLPGAGRAAAQEPTSPSADSYVAVGAVRNTPPPPQEPPTPSADSIVVVGAVRNTPQQIISFAGLPLHQPVTYRVDQRAI